MNDSKEPILPGTTVTVNNQESIYNGYEGFVQRISGNYIVKVFLSIDFSAASAAFFSAFFIDFPHPSAIDRFLI